MNELNDLITLVRSRPPIIVIESREEDRLVELLRRVAVNLQTRLFKWDATEGLRLVNSNAVTEGQLEPTEVLRRIWTNKVMGIYLLCDFHPYLSDPRNVRLIKDIALVSKQQGQILIFLSHQLDIPDEVRHLTARFELQLPDEATLAKMVGDLIKKLPQQQLQPLKIDERALKLLVKNLVGLTLSEAERIAAKALRNRAVTMETLPEVARTKYDLLNRGGVIYFEHSTKQFGDIGGFSRLKQWLQQRQAIFLGDLQLPGNDIPRGLLLIGVQGGGKSLAAKVVAGAWGVPLLRLDFGALADKYFGETERKTRDAFKTAELMAPCVLWMDEIEKGISTGTEDGGASRRVLGTLLTWMAERTSRVFLAATANDIQSLPPELLRKGRFDEIFFVDLPTAAVRKEIFSIHLKRRGLDPSAYRLDELAESSEGFSGAEIEQAIVSGLYSMVGGSGQLTNDILLNELRNTKPLSVVMAEQVEALRAWAQGRTVSAD